MKRSDSKKNPAPVMITLLPLLAMLTAIVPSIVYQNANLDTVKLSVIVLLLTGAVCIYIRVSSDGMLNKRLALTVITLSYLSSILLLLFVPDPQIFSFWMIGGLLVSMLIDNKLGLLLHFNLSFVLGIMITRSPEDVIQVLIIGLLMSMLAGSIKKPGTVIYSSIILLSSNITLAFAIHNFSFEEKLNNDYLKSLFSLFVVLATAFLLGLIYQAMEKRAITAYSDSVGALLDAYSEDQTPVTLIRTPSEEVVEAASVDQNIFSEAEAVQDLADEADSFDNRISKETRTSYELLCDLDNELIGKMKAHSQALYEHALHIGDLSYRAALEIGADEMLAFAGGLYHEVGKINGKNYIEEGLALAEEYSFPKELKAIIKEHNIKYEKPSSVEAAIVMLSDSVVSTIEYIEKTEEHKYTTNKVIDNIFQMRMDKGTFDLAALSLKDYKKLKEFYTKEFSKDILK